MDTTLVTTAKAFLAKTSGGLADLVKARKQSALTFLLIDCSYSMNDSVNGGYGGYGSQSKMDALRLIIGQLRRDGMNNPMVGFGMGRQGDVGFVEFVPSAEGGTPLTEAIQFSQANGAGHLIIISDGQPNNPQTALEAAYQFAQPIDVFYVGPKGDAGESFLSQLAGATGGKCQQVSLSEPKALTAGLRLMLSA